MSQTLKFTMLENYKWFEIEFESESEESNLLMQVTMDDFHLDVAELPQHHPSLYKSIKAVMKNNASSYWGDKKQSQSAFNDDSILKQMTNTAKTYSKVNYGIDI